MFDPFTFWNSEDYQIIRSVDIPIFRAELSKEHIEAIKNYSKEIETIKLFVDSVRQNPGEYLSNIGNEGWMNAVREVIQNATDEMNREISPCDYVSVEYWEGTHRCIVSDNGRAIPPEDIIRVYTREHTSTNFKKRKGVYIAGMHGIGSKATNAICSRFTVLSYRLGKAYKIDFAEGKPLPKYNMQPKEIPNKDNIQGLVIDFEPDFKIMKEITITCTDILNFLENLIPLLNLGAVIEFTGHCLNGTVLHKLMKNEEGIKTFLTRQTDKPMIKPIIFTYDDGTMRLDAAITYEANPNTSSSILTFANMTPVNTQLSTPAQGFMQGLCQFFRNHMNKVYLANSKKKIEVTNSDVTTGLVGALSAYHMNAIFSGQSKNELKNPEFVDFSKQVTIRSLMDWFKENPDDLQKLSEFFKDIAVARLKVDKEKINISKKFKTQAFWDLPPGFKKAERKDHLELFIVEGLSASAPCCAGRDPLYQAVFPIRGKMLNAFSTPRAKFLENKEVQGITAILGAGIGKTFDIDKCKYDKICLLADADSDGYHIRVLLLKCFLVYFRPLVEAGRIYAAISPLYHVSKGTKNWKYFIDRDDFIKYVRDIFYKEHSLFHAHKKTSFTKSELTALISNNSKYDGYLKAIADNYAIYPVLLEDLMILRNKSFKDIKKCIEGKYPYLKVSCQNNYPVLEGIVNDVSCGFVFNENLVNACSVILPYLDASEKRYILDGRKVGLYELITIYRQSEPKNIERAKGLGSLDASEIGFSTLDPNHRKLIRYTAEDIEAEIEEMRKSNDDKFQLIKDLDLSDYEF